MNIQVPLLVIDRRHILVIQVLLLVIDRRHILVLSTYIDIMSLCVLMYRR